MKTNYRGAVGMYPIDQHALCMDCKEPLRKKHGLNKNRPDEPPSVMAWFLGSVGPRCLWCHKKAWTDAEYWKRTGHSEYSAKRWDLNWDFRARD